jgi:hypothetical protein
MDGKSKRVGIMQPYFFPYFEQFRLIAVCDIWVVFDTPQYTRKSWINRNRILNRDKGWSYVTVPVKHTGLGTPINNALIDVGQDWREQVMNKLKVYQHEAPFYPRVRELVGDTLAQVHETIGSLNIAVLRAVCAYLGIGTPFLVASELEIDLPRACDPGEWALHISKSLGADEYRNPAGGRFLFDEALYSSNGITLSYHEHNPRTYHTGGFEFVDNLSVLDWMMWNDREVLRSWLR